MTTYGIGQDPKDRSYYVVIDGVRVASYPALKSALAHIDAHREHKASRPMLAFFEEGTLAVETVTRFLQERGGRSLVIDFTAPENTGGKWLQPLRDAAEKLRRAVLKARKSNPKPNKETR